MYLAAAVTIDLRTLASLWDDVTSDRDAHHRSIIGRVQVRKQSASRTQVLVHVDLPPVAIVHSTGEGWLTPPPGTFDLKPKPPA